MSVPLTLELLRARGACEPQVRLFAEKFGTSVEITTALCAKHANEFNFDWAGYHLFEDTVYSKFLETQLQLDSQLLKDAKKGVPGAVDKYSIQLATKFAELWIAHGPGKSAIGRHSR